MGNKFIMVNSQMLDGALLIFNVPVQLLYVGSQFFIDFDEVRNLSFVELFDFIVFDFDAPDILVFFCQFGL